MKTPRQANPRMYAALGVMTNDQLQSIYERTWQLIGVLTAPIQHHRSVCPYGDSWGCTSWRDRTICRRVAWALIDLDRAIHDVMKARGANVRWVRYTPSYLALEVAA